MKIFFSSNWIFDLNKRPNNIHTVSECTTGFHGYNCNSTCGHCNSTFPACQQANGYCLRGCENNWNPPTCDGLLYF